MTKIAEVIVSPVEVTMSRSNASLPPSGEYCGPPSARFAGESSSVLSAEPSAFATQNPPGPFGAPQSKMIRLPSGDQAGSPRQDPPAGCPSSAQPLPAGSLTIACAFEPSAFATQISAV